MATSGFESSDLCPNHANVILTLLLHPVAPIHMQDENKIKSASFEFEPIACR